MDRAKLLQALLDRTATKEEINLLKELLTSGEISIGGDVNHSVIIIGSGNAVEITSDALKLLAGDSTTDAPPPEINKKRKDKK